MNEAMPTSRSFYAAFAVGLIDRIRRFRGRFLKRGISKGRIGWRSSILRALKPSESYSGRFCGLKCWQKLTFSYPIFTLYFQKNWQITQTAVLSRKRILGCLKKAFSWLGNVYKCLRFENFAEPLKNPKFPKTKNRWKRRFLAGKCIIAFHKKSLENKTLHFFRYQDIDKYWAWFNLIPPRVTLSKTVEWAEILITTCQDKSYGEYANSPRSERRHPVLNHAKYWHFAGVVQPDKS